MEIFKALLEIFFFSVRMHEGVGRLRLETKPLKIKGTVRVGIHLINTGSFTLERLNDFSFLVGSF